MRNILASFVRDESGATAIEYGLIVSLMSVIIIPALASVGSHLIDTFSTLAGALQ